MAATDIFDLNLEQIREKFVHISGRYDLVADNGSDQGANFYINAGIRLLDEMRIHPKSMARHISKPDAGAISIEVTDVLAFKEVWAQSADGRSIVDKKSLGWIREEYAKESSEIDQGKPLYWSPAVLGLAPFQSALTADDLDGLLDWEDIKTGDHYNYDGIIFMPPTDGTYTISIWAEFYSKKLVADTDKNFWSVRYPILVIKAAMYQLESIYRNTEGMKDALNALDFELTRLDHASVRQEIAGINRMKG